MLREEMENLRLIMYNMIVSEATDSDELLKVSQEMDILILEFMKEKMQSEEG